MPGTDRTELKRLILQIERDLLAQSSFRRLTAAADATLLGHRQELRSLKERMRRRAARPPAVAPG